MKILYIVKNDLDGTAGKILAAHRASHQVTVFDIREDKDYRRLMDLIASSDKVISW